MTRLPCDAPRAGLNAIGGNANSQAAITATLANLSGVTKSADGRRRLCMSDQFSVLNTGVNATKLLEQVRLMLSLSLANDLPVSFSIDATQWWGGREDLFNFWNATRNETYDPANVCASTKSRGGGLDRAHHPP